LSTRSTIPIETAAGATVSQEPALVELYGSNDAVVRVAPESVDALIRAGFRRGPGDPRETYRRLQVMLGAAGHAINAYVEGVLLDGYVDTSDAAAKATAEIAMQEIEAAWGLLCQQLGFYPVKQGPVMMMRAPDGQYLDVDPAQAEGYLAMGWTLTNGASE
jgi:hypothetical protein